MSLTLLTGGVRAGKSQLATDLAGAAGGKVVFVATAEAGDEEMAARIERHRAARPQGWNTVEEPLELESVLETTPTDAAVIVDCLTLWVTNLMLAGGDDGSILTRASAAARLAAGRTGHTIAVTNEVGSGVVPATELGRRFADLLGRVNVAWADASDTAYLVVAGRALPLLSGTALEKR